MRFSKTNVIAYLEKVIEDRERYYGFNCHDGYSQVPRLLYRLKKDDMTLERLYVEYGAYMGLQDVLEEIQDGTRVRW